MSVLKNFEDVIKKINIIAKDDIVTLEVEFDKANFNFNRGTKVRKFRKQHAIRYLAEKGHKIDGCIQDAGLIGNIENFSQKGVWKFSLLGGKKAPVVHASKKTKKPNKEI